jgi:glutathione S-transferase
MSAAPIICYAFEKVPPFAQGLVRDLRVRWALEERGTPYESRVIGAGASAVSRAEYQRLQPFGQVPTLQDGELTLFESGAIVLHLAEGRPELMPSDAIGRAHTVQWMFAALNTIEPHVQNLAGIDLFHADKAWAKERRPGAVELVESRLKQLAAALGEREYLVGRFTAADLLMSHVLRILRHTDMLEGHPTLHAYRQRCEARPAFARALAAQMADFVPWQG